MKLKIAAGALGLAIVTGAAWAQSEAPPPPPPAAGAPAMSGGMAPPPPPPGAMTDRRGGPGDRFGPPERRGPRGGPRGWRHGPPPSKAAEFQFKRGPLSVRIRCAEEEPVKACTDAALVLMDKFATVAGPSPVPPPPPAGGAQPPAPPTAPAQ